MLVMMLGFAAAPTAQAQQQFSDGRYQYQVYVAPVNTPFQTQFKVQSQNQYYNQNIQSLLQQIAQLQRLLLQLQSDSVLSSNANFSSNSNSNFNSNFRNDSEVEVNTRSATDVRDDYARLQGEVSDFNRSNYADVWFEYGRSSSNLDKRTPIIRIDEDEDEDLAIGIGNLREDTRYYFRAVAEDDDEEKAYGSIQDFFTRDDGRNNNFSNNRTEDTPDVAVQNAFDVDEESARFEGDVDMNDFKNGEVFFVYGEAEDQIDDVANDYESYSDVDEDGDDIQKFRVDSSLDRQSEYEIRVTGLDDNTDYYFALCVGYEDEDTDDVIECSSTRSFETD